ncbi:MAG: hypothetical protein H7228_14620 [Polaromonas sp.]|nr:hypothetical protein [Polaromonas sp.]
MTPIMAKNLAKNLAQLQLERGLLLERISGQRATLVLQLAPWQKASDAGQRTVALFRGGVQYVKDHPLAILLAVSALVVFRPSSALRWAQRGLFVWRSWRSVRAWSAWVPQVFWRLF